MFEEDEDPTASPGIMDEHTQAIAAAVKAIKTRFPAVATDVRASGLVLLQEPQAASKRHSRRANSLRI